MLVDIDIIMRFTYPMFINKGKMTTNQGAYMSLLRIPSLISLLMKSFEDKIQLSNDHMDRAKGKTLEQI